MMILSFFSDLIEYTYLQRALIMAIFIGVVTGVLGSFIILSGKSLMGDALSHAILPGVVISYIIGINYYIGAVLMGLLATFLMSKISQKSKLKPDVSIGIIFTTFFALGIVLILKYPTATNLQQILFGNILTVKKSDMILSLITGVVVLVLIFVFYKAFLITIFDPTIGKTYGFNIKLYEHLLMVLLTLVVVSSLQAVGVILVVSMLVTPAASAYLWTKRFRNMIFLSAGIGSISSLIGLYLSFTFNLSTSGMIVLVLGFVFLVSYLFAKDEGIITKRFKKEKTFKEEVPL